MTSRNASSWPSRAGDGFSPTNNMTTAYRPGFTGDSHNSRHFWCQGQKNALRFLQIVPSKIPMRGLLSHFPVQENTKVYGARVRELIIKLRYTAFFFGFPLLLTDGQQTSKPPTHLRCAIPGARTGRQGLLLHALRLDHSGELGPGLLGHQLD